MYPCIQYKNRRLDILKMLWTASTRQVCVLICVLFIHSVEFVPQWVSTSQGHVTLELLLWRVFLCRFTVLPLPFSIFNNIFSLFKKKSNGNWTMEVIRTHTRALCVCKPGVLQTSPQSSLRLGLILLLYPQTALLSQPRIHDKEKLWRL